MVCLLIADCWNCYVILRASVAALKAGLCLVAVIALIISHTIVLRFTLTAILIGKLRRTVQD